METDEPRKEKAQGALPSALLKRLAKRGLIEKAKAKSLIENAEKREKNDKEEIIAEDYDEEDPGAGNDAFEYEYVRKPEESLWKERMKTRMAEGGFAGYNCCPNKYNIFHKCTVFCVDKWSNNIMEPSDEYLKRKKRLVRRYPLPQGWTEVYDSGCCAYYFWNQEDDSVSWLPPSHPKAHISKCAGSLRRELEESTPIDMDSDTIPPPPGAEDEPLVPTAINFNHNLENMNKIPEKFSAVIPRKTKSRDLDKALRTKRERRIRREESDKLDPMDPAAYSDIPRGTWASGLNNEERQSGADTTASGALFQMRPYPAPGAVLQANKKGGKSESDEDDNE